jgi:poly(3-hydroxybutyrate) depolymerase
MPPICHLLFAFFLCSQFATATDELPQTQAAETTSPLDGEKQPLLWWVAPSATTTETPLFVFLHSLEQ